MSNCSCVYTDADSYSTTLTHNKRVKARKNHVCGECHRQIPPGEYYEYYAGVCDGDFHTEKTCLDCLSLRESGVFCNRWRFGLIWDDFFDAIRDGGEDGILGEDGIPWAALSKLTPVAQAKAFSWIEFLWDEWEEEHREEEHG